MNNLGDLRWLNDWIGAEYKFGGRGPKFDCYGLVIDIYRQVFHVELPDWADLNTLDFRDNSRRIEEVVCSGEWQPTDTHSDGDFVICYRTKMAHHIGLYFGGGIIHCTEGVGVVYEPLTKFQKRYNRLEFGQWTP